MGRITVLNARRLSFTPCSPFVLVYIIARTGGFWPLRDAGTAKEFGEEFG